jgi:hypothetical protein
MVVGDIPAPRSVSLVISSGTPRRPGRPNVAIPRFTYRKADFRGHGAASPPRPLGPHGRRYRPVTFGAMINRKRADTMGLTMAHAMTFQADEVNT